jgi:hypothetical protein
MSRSNPTESTTHISSRWVEYKGDVGEFSYYDKEVTNEDGTKGANVSLGQKFAFLWLDETFTVTGYIEGGGGVVSNEIKRIREDVLTVRQFKSGNTFSGRWDKTTPEGEAFIAKVKAIGGKFTANLYIAYKDADNELKIGVLQLKGAAYSKWSEFFKANKDGVRTGAVSVSEHLDGKKGAVKFKTPVFKVVKTSEESDKAAIELDKQLQEFLKTRLAPAPMAPTAQTQPAAAPSQEQPPMPTMQQAPPLPSEEDDLTAMYGEDPFDDGVPF